MKKLRLILITLFLFCFAAGAEEIMYITSPDGLWVRTEPSLSAKKIDTLYYGEYVLVVEKGEKATIDGITANWLKVAFYDDDTLPEANGWVFGGYLSKEQPDLGKDSFEFINSYLKRSNREYFLAPYFPNDTSTYYFRDKEDWKFSPPHYERSLENLCQKDYYPGSKAFTIHECMYYIPPTAGNLVGYIGILPAGTLIELYTTGEYGIKDNVLFPIYEFQVINNSGGFLITGYIRGIDITSINHTSSVADGEGGSYTLYYQRALPTVNSYNYDYAKDKISQALNDYMTYEATYLNGEYEMNAVIITDPSGKSYAVGVYEKKSLKAHSLKLEYPLNMKHPVLFLKEKQFSGGMGGGYISTRFSTVELSDSQVVLRKAFSYGYGSADVGFDGMAYHYFTLSGAVVYEYQTDELGRVEHNKQTWFSQYSDNSSSPYYFGDPNTVSGEPEPHSPIPPVHKGDYKNPICRLKMRTSPTLNSQWILTLHPGTLLKIQEVGDKETIDGITAHWVKVAPVNDDTSVEGNIIKEWFPAEETAAWVFGGYLE
ncbi:MAG: SH3 domain-containing protein [Treponema sp.]|nr:SH3 domain-containing protein [Treponema sp.]